MKDGYFQELLKVDNQHCLIKIRQENLEGVLDIEYESKEDVELKVFGAKIMDIFGLNDDLNVFYNLLRKDSNLRPTIDFCSGF